MTVGESWGRYPRVKQSVFPLSWRHDVSFPEDQLLLPYGMGRSYGDCCLNDGERILLASGLNKFIDFDETTGVVRCEAGVTLEMLIDFGLPKGWFLPVTPGTKYVSVGGAIANDVHGKNHHRAGTFGCHVRSFELMRSNGDRILCSPEENGELFSATIGGMGLTGLILSVELQLKSVQGPMIDLQSIQFGSLDEFFALSAESDRDFEYTVSWIDCISRGKNLGRGIFMRGNHSVKPGPLKQNSLLKRIATVPIDAPAFLLNRFTMGAFNTVYYHKQREKKASSTVHYDPFFYPLDAVQHWNRIYGRKGFLQFQCVVPQDNKNEAMKHVFDEVVRSGNASFLAVMKEFGDVPSPGMMSFPRKGITLCLDFPLQGDETLRLMKRLDDMVFEFHGAMYPAKDATMAPEHFRRYYPQWEQFAEFIDPRFSSSFWRRVTKEGDA
ncbi:MAG: FAD-binding oxidoreductase [Bdellovibrionales bacterium]|nr:FAD-binding oxidoreductase [Bdellovibrionales bacterium]